MSKYKKVLQDISSVFTEIPLEIVPFDYKGSLSDPENFLKYSIVFSNANDYDHQRSTFLEGLLFIKIFTPLGKGPLLTYNQAGILDEFLENKTLPNGTVMKKATLDALQPDSANDSLNAASYRIQFSIYD